MITRILIVSIVVCGALGASFLRAQTQSPDQFMPNEPQKTGPENSSSFSVKYTLLLPSEKSSETVKVEERNPFGKGDEELHDVGGKTSNEETKIQEQLSKLRATGLSPGPNGMRVLFGDMWLSKNEVMPSVIKDQTLALRVNDITRDAIQLVWMEKKFTGLPPRMLVIPVDLRATVHRVPHGQPPDKPEKKQESKATKLATAVEAPVAMLAENHAELLEARKMTQLGATRPPAPATPPPPDVATKPQPIAPEATQTASFAQTSERISLPDLSRGTPSAVASEPPSPQVVANGPETSATQPVEAAQPEAAKAVAASTPTPTSPPSVSESTPPARPAAEPESWKRAMGLMENLIKLSEADK